LGTLHLASRLDTEGGTASLYPRAVSQAGYGDLLTVNLANPPAADGFLLVGVRVSGVLDASGNAGFATFQLAVTNDNATLAAGNPGYNKGTGGGISTDRQLPTWIASSFPAPGPLSEHRVIDEMVIFSIPVTFGTSFEMVVLGLSNTATRNSSGGAHSESDFGQTVTWAGVQGLLVGGVPVQGYTLTSGSGIDWTLAAAVPEPAAWWLFAAGLPLLVRLRSVSTGWSARRDGVHSEAGRHPVPARTAGHWLERWAPGAVSPHGLRPRVAPPSLSAPPTFAGLPSRTSARIRLAASRRRAQRMSVMGRQGQYTVRGCCRSGECVI
jgi:hypothetical protein